MAADVRFGASLDVHCAVQGHPFPLFPAVEDQLLRISKEAVTNVLRHADATSVELLLRFEPDRVFLEIRDDGRGFDPLQAQEGFGLLGMRDRAERIGGRLVAISEPGKGTRIAVSAPRGCGVD